VKEHVQPAQDPKDSTGHPSVRGMVHCIKEAWKGKKNLDEAKEREKGATTGRYRNGASKIKKKPPKKLDPIQQQQDEIPASATGNRNKNSNVGDVAGVEPPCQRPCPHQKTEKARVSSQSQIHAEKNVGPLKLGERNRPTGPGHRK